MAARSVLIGFGIIVLGTACSHQDSTAPAPIDTDVTSVGISLMDDPQANNGFYMPSDSVNLAASIVDSRGHPVGGRSLVWTVQLPDGKAPGDSIATISPMGPQTAQIVFGRPATVVVIASVTRNDGIVKTGKISVRWPE